MKSIFALLSTALWLTGVMHCPMEILGLLPSDSCCCQTSAASNEMGDAQKEKAGCSFEEFACRSKTQLEELLIGPVALAERANPFTLKSPAIHFVQNVPPENESSFLFQLRHFISRNALPTRAPTAFV